MSLPPRLRRWRHLDDNPTRRQRKIWVTSALVAALMLLTFSGSLFWSYRYHASTVAPSNVTATSPSLSPGGIPGTDLKIDAPTVPTDHDPFASFPQLPAAPQDSARPKPRLDPRSMRTLVDRGVAAYASAKTDADRAKAASEIQIAASAGFPSARVLLARNYPQSPAIRSVVPANDVVRYALALLMDPASESDQTKQIFLGLAQHFALSKQLDLFAAQILDSMRGDSRPRLNHRIDILLDVLSRVAGSCTALARLTTRPPDASDQECSLSLSEELRRHIEKSTSVKAK